MYICTLANLSPIDSILARAPRNTREPSTSSSRALARQKKRGGRGRGVSFLRDLPLQYTCVTGPKMKMLDSHTRTHTDIYIYLSLLLFFSILVTSWANLETVRVPEFVRKSFNVIWHRNTMLPPPLVLRRDPCQFTVKNRRSRSIRWEPGSFLECERQPVCVLFAWSAIVGLASRPTSLSLYLSLSLDIKIFL